MTWPFHLLKFLRRNAPWCAVAGWLAAWSPIAIPAADSASAVEFFEKRVRPILVERCYECHSTTGKKIKGGLRLDSREGWANGGDSGPAIAPGDPEESLLIQAVRWLDQETQMPPKNKLPQAEIDALVEWVRMGAPDPRGAALATLGSESQAMAATNHWAYQPVIKPLPPEVKQSSWPRSKIDGFILGKLEVRSLPPAPDADPATLARRLHFDLTGLPPTPEELEGFMELAGRNRQAAIESLVDRLLASPRFGEHWGRHWLDVARFGESVTLRGFIFKEAWRYRDYIIDSFNRDVPFDQTIREQIAGDLLPWANVDERRRKMIATTFLVLGNWNLEEQDKKQLDMDVVDEQLDTIGKAFLGQTIGCARCHDHKFDPIPTRDYYAMAGILKNAKALKHANVSEWIEVPLPVEPGQEKALQEHETEIVTLQSEIKAAKEKARAVAGISGEPKPGFVAGKAAVLAPKELPGIVADSAQARLVGSWKHSQYSKHYIGDGYWHDDNQGKGEKTLTFTPELAKPGRYEVRFAYIHSPSRSVRVPVTIFHADGETTVHVNQQEPPVIEGRFVSLGHFRFEANGFGYALVSNEGTEGHVTADAVQFLPLDGGAEPGKITAKPVASPNPNGSAAGPAAREPDMKALEARLKRLQESGPKRPKVMGVIEAEQIEDIPVHIRGNVHNLGAKVPRGFLTVAARGTPPRVPEKESGRLQFAEWMAGTNNPLTARVMANRVWLWLMGEGLVRTPDNFGTTGEAPSHPELLDYLAIRLIEQGWSVKKLAREIVLSRTYQLSSKAARGTPRPSIRNREPDHGGTERSFGASGIDPENRLFSHAHRRRLSAEQIRDAMLAISGQLRINGGGQTYPAQRSADFGFVFTEPLRSVYAPVFRNALPEIFEVFDFAPSSMVTGRRNVSTVPTQALFLLNHPFVREQAEAAAKRLSDDSRGNDAPAIDRAYRLTLGRLPTEDERTVARRHISGASNSVPRTQVWTELFHALFASADFRHID
jgi:hypothetical protein